MTSTTSVICTPSLSASPSLGVLKTTKHSTPTIEPTTKTSPVSPTIVESNSVTKGIHYKKQSKHTHINAYINTEEEEEKKSDDWLLSKYQSNQSQLAGEEADIDEDERIPDSPPSLNSTIILELLEDIEDDIIVATEPTYDTTPEQQNDDEFVPLSIFIHDDNQENNDDRIVEDLQNVSHDYRSLLIDESRRLRLEKYDYIIYFTCILMYFNVFCV